MEGQDTAIVILSASLLYIAREVIDGTLKEIAERTGLPEAHIIMAATHTHSGPINTKEYNLLISEDWVYYANQTRNNAKWFYSEARKPAVEVELQSILLATGYLPTGKAFSEGDCEVYGAKYSEEAAQVLIEATLEQL